MHLPFLIPPDVVSAGLHPLMQDVGGGHGDSAPIHGPHTYERAWIEHVDVLAWCAGQGSPHRRLTPHLIKPSHVTT